VTAAAEKRVRVTVTVNAGSRGERVERIDASRLRVAVSEPAREGRANAAVVKAVARFLGVPPSAVHILHGARSRSKVLEIKGGR
jgi:uncharacterized protein (TIGR00251 family)